MENNSYGNKWNKFFSEGHYIWKNPDIKIKRIVPFLKRRKVKKILDLGCGAGRHMIYLGKKGFIMIGLDFSAKALSIAQSRLERESVKNYVLINHAILNLPFPDDHFDAVVSINVVHHDRIKNIRKTISEIKRVLKKRGIVIINLASTENTKFGRGKEIEKNTFIKSNGNDKGVLHHFFSEKEARGLFSGFKIRELRRDNENNKHWFILAEK